MSMDWERLSESVMQSPEGYRVLRYRFDDGRQHFEAWPPRPGKWIDWPDCHRMLGIRKRAKAAMELCEKHLKEVKREDSK